MMKAMTESVAVGDGPAKAALVQRAATFRQRMDGGTRAALALQVTASC
jgi:hypothetical protein